MIGVLLFFNLFYFLYVYCYNKIKWGYRMNNEKQFENEAMIYKSSLLACFIFLGAHIAYLVFFLVVKLDILIYTNIGSIIFYLICLLLIKYKHYATFAILTAFEIAFYMTFAAVVTGQSSGFQLCLIGLTMLVFFAGYFSKTRSNKIKPIWFSILYMILFGFLYFYFQFNEPLRKLDHTVEIILFVGHIIVVFSFDITFLTILTSYTVKLEKGILSESVTDKLTNIANRNGLINYFEMIGEQRCNYTLAMFDIDNFKIFNDVNGHLCGDYVLQEIARIAKENSADDFVSRWGGEEFIIISKTEENLDKTCEKIDKIRKTIEDFNFQYNNKNLKSTITIGVAEYENEMLLDDWIKKADKKLYEGKQNGKNRLVK